VTPVGNTDGGILFPPIAPERRWFTPVHRSRRQANNLYLPEKESFLNGAENARPARSDRLPSCSGPAARTGCRCTARSASPTRGGGGGRTVAGSGSGPIRGSPYVDTGLFGRLAARQWSLGRIRAEAAWRRIAQRAGREVAPGTGQTIGAVDSGIDRGHPAFCGGSAACTKTVTGVFLRGTTDETGARSTHGTAVAGVIVGRLQDASGVAWGADVAMFALPLGSGGGYSPVSLAGLPAGPDARLVADRVNHPAL